MPEDYWRQDTSSTSSLDRAGYVIAQADGPEQAVSLCDQAMKKIRFIVREEG